MARIDVFTGMLFANTVMYFIILTTAATLHASGQTVVAVSLLLGMGFNYFGFNAVKMFFYSAVLNGVLAPSLPPASRQ